MPNYQRNLYLHPRHTLWCFISDHDTLWLISDVCQPDGRQIPPRCDSELWKLRFQSKPDHTLMRNHQKKTWLSPMPDMNVFLFSFHFYSLTVMVGGCQESSGLIPELRHIKGTHECVPSSLHITKTQMHAFLYLHFIGHLLEMEICWTRDQKCVTQTSQIQDGRTGGYVYCYLISCNKTVVDEQ